MVKVHNYLHKFPKATGCTKHFFQTLPELSENFRGCRTWTNPPGQRPPDTPPSTNPLRTRPQDTPLDNPLRHAPGTAPRQTPSGHAPRHPLDKTPSDTPQDTPQTKPRSTRPPGSHATLRTRPLDKNSLRSTPPDTPLIQGPSSDNAPPDTPARLKPLRTTPPDTGP
nr:extensin-like [Penaeus vannamei]